MDTEYRRGIPSTAHVEAATRLGLLWHRRGRDAEHRTRFVVENGQVLSDYGEEGDQLLALGPVTNNERHYAYYCIRPDGTPVDWEVLDLEVARVGQPATVTSTASAAPTTQPQGFRADLWARLSRHFSLVFRSHDQISSLTEISSIDDVGIHSPHWQWGWGTADREAPTHQNRADILARWAVYQELKPLYDLVDGARGEATMPRDVYNECRARAGWTGEADDRWLLRYNSRLEAVGIGEVWHGDGHTSFERANMRNFAAVLDAVAERRVAERGQAPTVTSTVIPPPSREPQPRRVNVEPRRFADVRPDRHGWRWWRVANYGVPSITAQSNRIEVVGSQHRFIGLTGLCDWIPTAWESRTVIPTDEQGNPVSWEAAGFAAEVVRPAQESVQRAANDATPARSVGDIEWTVTGLPVTRDMTVEPAVGTARSRHVVRLPAQAPEMQSATEVPALSRIALIEIDDADPTAERIRLEQEAERQRLAELRLRLAAERPVQMAKESDTVSRFDLIEPDPQADPAASIRAWEARQKRSTVRLMPKPQPQPLPAPCRLFEVVDAEAEGLRPGAVFTALLGRALNPNC